MNPKAHVYFSFLYAVFCVFYDNLWKSRDNGKEFFNFILLSLFSFCNFGYFFLGVCQGFDWGGFGDCFWLVVGDFLWFILFIFIYLFLVGFFFCLFVVVFVLGWGVLFLGGGGMGSLSKPFPWLSLLWKSYLTKLTRFSKWPFLATAMPTINKRGK